MNKNAFFLIVLGLLVIYWVPALPFPEQTKGIVNASYLLLAVLNVFILSHDVVDMVATHGEGMSWQAMTAKTGLFLLVLGFSLARVWSISSSLNGYPDWMLTSPIGTFFPYVQGIGLAGIFYGFGSVGDISPRFSYRGLIALALAIGVAIGVGLSHLPV